MQHVDNQLPMITDDRTTSSQRVIAWMAVLEVGAQVEG